MTHIILEAIHAPTPQIPALIVLYTQLSELDNFPKHQRAAMVCALPQRTQMRALPQRAQMPALFPKGPKCALFPKGPKCQRSSPKDPNAPHFGH